MGFLGQADPAAVLAAVYEEEFVVLEQDLGVAHAYRHFFVVDCDCALFGAADRQFDVFFESGFVDWHALRLLKCYFYQSLSILHYINYYFLRDLFYGKLHHMRQLYTHILTQLNLTDNLLERPSLTAQILQIKILILKQYKRVL